LSLTEDRVTVQTVDIENKPNFVEEEFLMPNKELIKVTGIIKEF